MKKILLLLMIAGAFSCSKEELVTQTENIEVVNVQTYVDQCVVTSFNFGPAGTIYVKNDRDFIYYTFTANKEYVLSDVSLHYTKEESGFPTNNGGNIQTKSFFYQKVLEVGVVSHEYKVSNKSYGYDLLVAANVTFTNSLGEKTSFWAGDVSVKKGNWSYFTFNVQVPPYNTGNDNSITLTVSQADALPSWDEVRKLYASLVEPGLYKIEGTFQPSIWEIINTYNDPAKSKIGKFTTTYTLGTENCFDSVNLTINVVEDSL